MGVMGKRTSTTAADLFVLLDREFRRRKPRECAACYVSLPYRIDASGSEAANWELVLPSGCGRGCDMVLEDLVLEFQALYRLNGETRDTTA